MGVPQLASNSATTAAERKSERAGYGATARVTQADVLGTTETVTVQGTSNLSVGGERDSSLWTPVDPRTQLSPKERFQLAWSAARPWREWASWRALALPPSWLDWSTRVRMNLELYVWNYMFVLLAAFVVTGLFYPWSALFMGVWILLVMYMGANAFASHTETETSLGARILSSWPVYVRYTLLGGLLLLLLFTTEAVTLVLTSASIALALTLLHAAFHDPAEAVPSLSVEYIAAP